MVNVKFSFCCWNVRGLGQPKKCSDVLSELIAINPHACFLQETKLSTLPILKQKSFLPRHLDIIHPFPSTGSAGGMLSAFSSAHFALLAMDAGTFTQSSTISCLASPHALVITNVYAPTDHAQKSAFLHELSTCAPTNATPWIILGDFNLLRHPAEKNTAGFRQAEADMFNDFINSNALIELPLLDRSFTWSSKRDRPTLEKIDRVFINNDWDLLFPNTSIASLTRFVSDHVPLIISIDTIIPRPALFRFENRWALRPACRLTIQSSWAAAQTRSTHALSLAAAFKRSRSDLKTWRRLAVPLNTQENNCKTVISVLDLIEETRFLSPPELALRRVVIKVLQ